MRNFKSIDRMVFGRGTVAKISEIITKQKSKENDFAVYLIDDFFENKNLVSTLNVEGKDKYIFISTIDEPTTELIDQLTLKIRSYYGFLPVALVGVGGGSVMDVCKATSLMLTNEGKAHEYQGLDLIRNKGVYSIVVPTISGTGAEVSMTAVLTGPTKKLGIKCDFTVPDQVILDANLIDDVPNPQRFYTGMDCYIHGVEALTGTWRNPMGDSFGEKSLELCKEVFLNKNISRADADEKLMVASYMGGLSLTYSQVGVCHALSYGLSYVLHLHHGIANCIAFNYLQKYYPWGVEEFHQMLDIHNIVLPKDVCKNLSDSEINLMVETAYALDHMWDHAFGKDWKTKISKQEIKELYLKM